MQKLTEKLQRLGSKTAEEYYHHKRAADAARSNANSKGHRTNPQHYSQVYGQVPEGAPQKPPPVQMFQQGSPDLKNHPVRVVAPLAPGTPMSPSRIPTYLPGIPSGPNDGLPAGLVVNQPSVPYPVYTPQKNPSLPQHQNGYAGGNPNLLTPNVAQNQRNQQGGLLAAPGKKNPIPSKSQWEREKAQIQAEINQDMAKFNELKMTHLMPESTVMFDGPMMVNESRFIQDAQQQYGGPSADALPDPPAGTEYINPMGFARKNTINLTGNAGVTVYSRSESSGY